jgi:hypothetical protein
MSEKITIATDYWDGCPIYKGEIVYYFDTGRGLRKFRSMYTFGEYTRGYNPKCGCYHQHNHYEECVMDLELKTYTSK